MAFPMPPWGCRAAATRATNADAAIAAARRGLWAVLFTCCVSPAKAQRAFKMSSSTCTLTTDATQCQVASSGDAVLQVAFSAGRSAGEETTLTLDMANSLTCSASNIDCPQVFSVTSDNTANVIKIRNCAYYKTIDYSSHLMTYTFINVGSQFPFVIKDDHDRGRGVVPPGAVRECFCHCSANCHLTASHRLYCTHNSPR
mmetsp:Transcript_55795/g.155549  ORF Transcript_55795/g.155549 Transcript_55795/m.155549 type:complete len:200 (+) Transcript_55795:77-676(+)